MTSVSGDEVAVLTAAHERNLRDEEVGVRHRIEHFYVPLFERHRQELGMARSPLRILDCGCGNGASVALLSQAGFRAFGIDLWSVRARQWKESRRETRTLCVADATRLPFRDRSFDIVFSCGLLEHIGVAEEGHPKYTVEALTDQRELRARFFSESLRVLKPSGLIYVDHPNGAFPVDFWHNDYRNRPRVHSPFERFLPTFHQIRSLVRSIAPSARVEAVSPAGRFTFQRSRRRWDGRLFGSLMERYFALLQRPLFAPLARTFLNPYLVIRIRTS